MRTLTITFAAMACIGMLLFGCNVQTPDDALDNAQDFLGVNVNKFSGTSALDTQPDTTTSESIAFPMPTDLLPYAPENATFVISMPDVAVVLAEESVAKVAGNSFEASVTFKLAPLGEDACASDYIVGPFELTIDNGKLTVNTDTLPLDDETRTMLMSGDVEICVEAYTNFFGQISIGKVSIEFGELKGNDTKVDVCHIPSNNSNNKHDISVGNSAVDAHLEHGDYLGACRDLILDLEVTGVCADDPDVQRHWQITNPNSFDVVANWDIVGTDQTGQVTVPAGHYSLLTDTVEGDNTLELTWRNQDGEDQLVSALSINETCTSGDVDDDKDGINNDADACADTTEGEAIDSNGCSCSQLDADNDGVDDCTDICAETSAAEADVSGCSCDQRDSDNDGVDDCDDVCAETEADAVVDATGCPAEQVNDSDADGVTDDVDVCLGTPAGQAVDADGCGCSQLDEDSDGVSNCNDLCPGTTPGATVNVSGCEVMGANAGDAVTLPEVGPVTLQGSASGGTPPYRYNWTAANWAGSNQQNPTVVPSETTTYTLTVTDFSLPPRSATATVTVTIEPYADLRYTITSLGSPSANGSYANAINDSGQVVGYYYDATWQQRAFRYTNNTIADMGTLGGASAQATGINSNGEIVGDSVNAGGEYHAFKWDSVNGMQDLGTLGGTSSTAYSINDAGQVVGYAADGSANNHAFLYDAGGMASLGIVDYYMTVGLDINNSATIVGALMPLDSDTHAFVHDNGVLTDLGSPLLDGSLAWAINDAGSITGYSWEGVDYRSWLYIDGVVIDLGVPTGYQNVFMWGINDDGRLVGSMADINTGANQAILYAGGEIRELHDLLVPGHGWDSLDVANDINSNGQIVGYGTLNGVHRAFLLTPVP